MTKPNCKHDKNLLPTLYETVIVRINPPSNIVQIGGGASIPITREQMVLRGVLCLDCGQNVEIKMKEIPA